MEAAREQGYTVHRESCTGEVHTLVNLQPAMFEPTIKPTPCNSRCPVFLRTKNAAKINPFERATLLLRRVFPLPKSGGDDKYIAVGLEPDNAFEPAMTINGKGVGININAASWQSIKQSRASILYYFDNPTNVPVILPLEGLSLVPFLGTSGRMLKFASDDGVRAVIIAKDTFINLLKMEDVIDASLMQLENAKHEAVERYRTFFGFLMDQLGHNSEELNLENACNWLRSSDMYRAGSLIDSEILAFRATHLVNEVVASLTE